VQLGAFRHLKDAQATLKTFSSLNPYITQSWDSNNQMWYLVRYGPFETFEAANTAALKFKDTYKKGAIAYQNPKSEKRINILKVSSIRKKKNDSSPH